MSSGCPLSWGLPLATCWDALPMRSRIADQLRHMLTRTLDLLAGLVLACIVAGILAMAFILFTTP